MWQKVKSLYTKINWLEQSLEIFVVFIGITGAFLLNSWRMDMDTRDLERKYIESFLKNVQYDSLSLATAIPANKNNLTAASYTIFNTMKKKDWPLDSAEVVMNKMMEVHPFEQNRTTYESVLNSGNLDIISDYKLTESIVEYYNSYEQLKMAEKLYLDWLIDVAMPFIYKNTDMLNQSLSNKKAFRDYRFTNMCVGWHTLLSQNIEQYNEMSGRNKTLKNKLQEYLKNF